MPLSEKVVLALIEAEREVAREGFWWTAELTGLLADFAAAGLRVIPLKGPFLAERIDGAAALRPCRDLDLLVSTAQSTDSEALLLAMGFDSAMAPDDYHRSWRRGTTNVELHHDVENPLAFDFKIAEAWNRSRQADFNGQPVWQLEAFDE